jgi:[ribosomal protein S18]-alanine N-acetyltransferase
VSAVVKDAELYIRPMQEEDVDHIMAIETRAYEFPWSNTIFQDCLRVGYCSWVLERDGALAAYGVMSVAVGESHILNLCVDPDYQSLGLGRMLLTRLLEVAQDHDANMTFLEVRPSNFAAIKLYLDMGFDEIGMRRNYYPAKMGREDALIFAKSTPREEDFNE